MRTLILTGLLFYVYQVALAQMDSRKDVRIPDIPGYLTLKCDFHMHTIFSDLV